MVLYGKDYHHYGRKPQVWKDDTIEDAIIVTENVMKATKPKTVNSWWKNCPDAVHVFTGFTIEPIQKIIKETVDMSKNKVGGEGFQDVGVGDIQELRHHTRGNNRRWLHGDECFQINARWWWRWHKRSSARNKLTTLDNLAKVSNYSRLFLTSCTSSIILWYRNWK